MGRIRTLSLALATVAVAGLLVSSMGFTSVTATRGVSVDVVSDEDAYIGYDSADLRVSDGDRVALVTVANRLFGPVSVTDVSVASAHVGFENVSNPSLAPGEQAPIEGTVVCSSATTDTVELTVILEGEGVMATIYGDTVTREFDVTCAAPSADARFLGAGNFELLDPPVATSNISYWTASAGSPQSEREFTRHTLDGFDTNGTLQSQVSGTPRVVAVYVSESDVTYYHPQFDPTNRTIASWKAGPAKTLQGEIDLSG